MLTETSKLIHTLFYVMKHFMTIVIGDQLDCFHLFLIVFKYHTFFPFQTSQQIFPSNRYHLAYVPWVQNPINTIIFPLQNRSIFDVMRWHFSHTFLKREMKIASNLHDLLTLNENPHNCQHASVKVRTKDGRNKLAKTCRWGNWQKTEENLEGNRIMTLRAR